MPARAASTDNALARLAESHRIAAELMNSGQPAVASRDLKALLRALDRMTATKAVMTLRTRVLVTLAKVDLELKGTAAGIRRLDEAVRLAPLASRELLTSIHNQRGVLLLRSGQFGSSIAEFDEGERWFETASLLDRANILLNRSTALMMTGSLRPAARDLARLTTMAERHDAIELQRFRAMALHNHGYLRFLLGDLPGALGLMTQSAGLLTSDGQEVTLLDRARVLLEAGLVAESDARLAEAAELARVHHLSQDLAEIELERARCALVRGDVSAARRLAGSARDRFRRRGSDTWRRSAELILLQGDIAAGRPGRRLLAPALRLRSEFDDAGLHMPSRMAVLLAAEAALSAGEVERAAELASAIGSTRRDPITARLHASYVKAALRRHQGQTAAASREARRGLAELTAYQATFGSIDLQTAAAVHGRRLAELDVAIALDGGRAANVLRAAELARAASNRLPTVRPPADRETADLLAELRRTAESLHATQDRDESAALQRRRRHLEGQIAARGWTLTGPGEARAAATVDEIRATAQRTGSALVTFVEARGALHAVVVDDAVRLHALGSAAERTEQVRRARADLDVLAQPSLPAAMRDAVRASLERSMRALDSALIAPLGVDGRRLVVVSTGVFGQLPWSGLPSLRGVPIVVAPSATSWLSALSAPRRRKRSTVALSGPGVPYGDREAKSVASSWTDADVRSGSEADRRSLVDALSKAAVVHVAAHGVHQTENAMFSSLRMADGLVFAHELDRTRRTAEHVVLSACELGLATVRPGDEALGLMSVLLRLGTRSVVAGVARVNDEVASDVMAAYHRQLASGVDSATALADALAATDAIAPFVCFGSAWRA